MRTFVVICLFFLAMVNALGQSQGDTVFNQTDKQGLKQGYWRGYFDNKKLKYTGTFKDNKPVGTFKRYYPEGQLRAVMVYNAAGTKAFTTLYYQNGTKAAQGNYIGNVKDSIWNYYSFYDKTIASRENFVKGKKEGIALSYYPSGKTSQELQYQNDLKHGIWKQYFENGTIKISATYNKGMRTGDFIVNYPNGTPEWKGKYLNDKKEGKWINYNPDGSVASEIEFVNGIAKNSEELNKKESQMLELIEKIKGSIPEPDENSLVPGAGM